MNFLSISSPASLPRKLRIASNPEGESRLQHLTTMYGHTQDLRFTRLGIDVMTTFDSLEIPAVLFR